MLVLEPEEIPDEAAKHLEKSEQRDHNVLVRFTFQIQIVESNEPNESDDYVLHDCQIVVVLSK